MSTSSTSRGRHAAPLSFDAERQEYLAHRDGHARTRPGRHVACPAFIARTEGQVFCALGFGHVVDGLPHTWPQPFDRALPIFAPPTYATRAWVA